MVEWNLCVRHEWAKAPGPPVARMPALYETQKFRDPDFGEIRKSVDDDRVGYGDAQRVFDPHLVVGDGFTEKAGTGGEFLRL